MDCFNMPEDRFDCDFLLQHSDDKFLGFTGDSKEHSILRMVEDNSIFEDSFNGACNFFAEMPMEDSSSEEMVNKQEIPQRRDQKQQKERKKKYPPKAKKNSNAIKKMGRIIMSNLEKYELPNQQNEGVKNMKEKLEERNGNKKAKAMVDGFNTYHLQALFDAQEETSKFNLRTTRKIFTRSLRNEVLDSFQIKGESKLLYLKTLKCSSLRFMNRRLANRLQTSQNQQ